MSARLAHIATALLLILAATASAAPSAGKGGRKDTTPPSIAIAAPTAGATLTGSVDVTGSAADNVQVASVQVSLDGGPYRSAAGATSWSFALDSGAYADGLHTLSAKATDSSGHTTTTNEAVSFANTALAPPPPPPPPPPPADTTPPSVAVLGPAPGATVGGTVTITGSASDNSALAKVELKVDSGAYQLAQGTNAWTFALATTAYADGAHTLTARATDTAGNTATSTVSVSVSNAAPPPSAGPGQMVTPEGATIVVDPDVAGWTPQQVYDLLKPNAYQLSLIGPSLTVRLQTASASSTSASAVKLNGVYSSYKATVYLQAKDGTTFTNRPDAIMAHEYGHAWTLYHLYMSHQGDWTPYLTARGILGDPRLDSSYVWTKSEMIADDYRLLFGTAAAQDELAYLNPDVADPRAVAGLRDFFLNTWGT